MATFTERETKLMALAWQCFDEEPKVDMKKLAALADYTNPKSAANAWSAIKKKLKAGASISATGTGTPGSGKKTAGRKPVAGKKRKGDGDGDGTDNEEPVTPVKAPGRRGRKSVKMEVVAEEEEQSGGGVKDEGGEEDQEDESV